MDHTTDLKICSYNCRSLKSSVYDVIKLCESHDIVCLQDVRADFTVFRRKGRRPSTTVGVRIPE